MKKVDSKAPSDPFALSLEEYLVSTEEQQWALTQKLYERHGDWIRQQFQKTRAALLVLCDRQVIYSSADRYDFQADEVVAQAQQQRKKPCFILTRPVLVEAVADGSQASTSSILSRARKVRTIFHNVFNSTLLPFSIREITAGLV